MKKIAFIGHDLKFVRHIAEYLHDKGHEVRFDEWSGHDKHDEAASLELVEWADVLFCEWGLGNVVWYQRHKKEHQKLLVRVHRFEMNTKYPAMFDYTKIDRVIAISPYIYEEFHRVAGIPRESMTVIYNAVDTGRFDREKHPDAAYQIGIVGIVPKLKRLDRAVDILAALYEHDKRYRLFVKGKHPQEYGWVWNNPEERAHYDQVFERLEQAPYKDHVQFEGWGDVAEWLQQVGYVLSVSDYESFHMAPIEGMAAGAYPVVLRREGVNTVFPREYIFENTEEAVRFILQEKEQDAQDLKRFVRDSYDLSRVCAELEKLMQ